MLRAFLRMPSGVVALVALGLIVITALVAPLLLTERATVLNLLATSRNPSAQHWLGTDNLGRDIFARILVGTRASIGLAFAAAALGGALGIVMGSAAAAFHGRLRTVSLRTIDAFIAFPALLIAIFVGAIIGPGSAGVVIGVGVATSFGFARVTSSLSIAIAERDYISAARISGISPLRLILRYVLPNIGETLAITSTVAVSNSIVIVATLSFLGLGVQPPGYDWGTMLTEGVQAIYETPAAALGPAVAIALAALAFGFLGETLARAMNPVLWTPRHAAERGMEFAPPPIGTAIDGGAEMAPPSHGGALLSVVNLSVRFPRGRGDFGVVQDVSFSLQKGDRLGIVGKSGSGKTTTALAIAQLVHFPGRVTGKVELQGHDISASHNRDKALRRILGTELAVVYQDPLSALNPALRIGTQMAEATVIHRGVSRRDARKMAAQRLREVNVPGGARQLSRFPHVLSGGMRQRVMIGMGLVTEPALLICDEPTTSLDVTVQAQIMDLLARINSDRGITIILISHNLALVSQNTDRVLVMYAGRVVEDLTSSQLLSGGLHPYTRQLVATIPDMSRPRGERLATIPGQAPDPAALPTGCPYQPRCPLAFDKCRVVRPPLRPHAEGRRVACWAVDENRS